jgi:hypothetical protein
MSDQSAIRLLQTAIETIRENCTGSEYKELLSACDAADSAAERCLGEPDDSAQDKREENDRQPKDLKAAAEKTRAVFADRRKSPKSDNSGVPDKQDTTK